MELTRRQMLVTSGAALASIAGLPAFASATDDMIAELTGGASLGEGAITLDSSPSKEHAILKFADRGFQLIVAGYPPDRVVRIDDGVEVLAQGEDAA